eukprot:CAMPEP_0179082144 /NCGR_PEP_ID=MMETSP0796-20121207/37025_1 /TAXON_ID=73915 /ORGANISM="Pyrodinium bahamense, Strain pbaha01" /LENGTH=126 /DNA_ID=CAMNT_0020779539 /DNA_START=256 /DNA_END=636 /DNA_ORIENTATION=-
MEILLRCAGETGRWLSSSNGTSSGDSVGTTAETILYTYSLKCCGSSTKASSAARCFSSVPTSSSARGTKTSASGWLPSMVEIMPSTRRTRRLSSSSAPLSSKRSPAGRSSARRGSWAARDLLTIWR